MTVTHVYISPHFDDVVFSCVGQIIADVKNGIRVIVITVFTKGAKSEYSLREKENNQALKLLNAECINLGFLDAPYRHDFYHSFQHIILERSPSDDMQFVESLYQSLKSTIQQVQPTKIYAPLGIGTHVDHRLCYEAVQKFNRELLYFYEDRPYCFTEYSVIARLNELGIQKQQAPLDNHSSDSVNTKKSLGFLTNIEVNTCINSLLSKQYVQQYLTNGQERDECLTILKQRLQRKVLGGDLAIPLISSYSGNMGLVELALNAYESQIEFFLENSQSYIEQAIEYANKSLELSTYGERYWRITN